MADQVYVMNDEIIIFRLQKCFDLKTNREVANFLGLSESMVSKILKGKKSLSLFYRLKILCKFGRVTSSTELLAELIDAYHD
ncbi:helix-turn-helix transcriptional regulator [Methylicorpusculum sp.]|uniref:helix-turn-helix transcriptional regulator n=2 Tax=Methylicorpusculum sp. TaxID=2713644 RepID=UPI002AC8E708|nr:helix-turn-helix transcriptional regulator [Methylicorpusculum sp.]